MEKQPIYYTTLAPSDGKKIDLSASEFKDEGALKTQYKVKHHNY